MNRKQALKTLSENRNQLIRFSVKDLYIFGSVARDESIEGSDVDILVGQDFSYETDDSRHVDMRKDQQNTVHIRFRSIVA